MILSYRRRLHWHLLSGHFQLEESESLAQLRFRVITKAIPSCIFNHSESWSPHGVDHVQILPSRLRDHSSSA